MTQVHSDRLGWGRLAVMTAAVVITAYGLIHLMGVAVLLAAGRAAWRLTALAAVLASVPVIGLVDEDSGWDFRP